jgi:hypothetical protein
LFNQTISSNLKTKQDEQSNKHDQLRKQEKQPITNVHGLKSGNKIWQPLLKPTTFVE